MRRICPSCAFLEAHRSVGVLPPFFQLQQHRGVVTTRGQFNPIHSFNFEPVDPQQDGGAEKEDQAKEAGGAFPTKKEDIHLFARPTLKFPRMPHPSMIAKNKTQFVAMITNPGPLRITYSPDYLDWYYKAYMEKVKYQTLRVEREREAGKLAKSSRETDRAGSVLLPWQSYRRQLGESQKCEGQKMIEKFSIQHGMYDCLERQSQFPGIHIDKCTNFHIREILKQMFFSEALSEKHLWEKALLHTALLQERRNMYPPSFTYIFEHVDAFMIAIGGNRGGGSSATRRQEARGAAGPGKLGGSGMRAEAMPPSAPMADALRYFQWLVKKYHVYNGIEAHVVLMCHSHPDVETLLLSQPPPMDDDPTQGPPPSRPTTFPPISALLEDDVNLHLARCLIFAEFNTAISENPFVKYPNAEAFLLRPRRGSGGRTMTTEAASEYVSESRGAFAPLQQIQQSALESRAHDVRMLESQHVRQDQNFGAESLPKLAEESPAQYPFDSGYFNPRTIRAELRDLCSRRVLRGLRLYGTGREKCYRPPAADLLMRCGALLEYAPEMPLPTMAHFLRVISRDPHVSFASTNSRDHVMAMRIRNAVGSAAAQLYKMSLEYHDPQLRRLHYQKLQIGLAILDRVVGEELRALRQVDPAGRGRVIDSLGSRTSWVGRPLDAYGFPPGARMDDYNRWMAKPVTT